MGTSACELGDTQPAALILPLGSGCRALLTGSPPSLILPRHPTPLRMSPDSSAPRTCSPGTRGLSVCLLLTVTHLLMRQTPYPSTRVLGLRNPLPPAGWPRHATPPGTVPTLPSGCPFMLPPHMLSCEAQFCPLPSEPRARGARGTEP